MGYCATNQDVFFITRRAGFPCMCWLLATGHLHQNPTQQSFAAFVTALTNASYPNGMIACGYSVNNSTISSCLRLLEHRSPKHMMASDALLHLHHPKPETKQFVHHPMPVFPCIWFPGNLAFLAAS